MERLHLITTWKVLRFSVLVAIAAAVLGVILKVMELNNICGFAKLMRGWTNEDAAYKSFQGVLGFFLIFRTSQGYSRYMEAGNLLHQMQGSFFEAYSSIIAFLKTSKADSAKVKEFARLLATLFSLLNALTLHSLEAGPDRHVATWRVQELDIVGADDLSEETVFAVASSRHKVALLFHWVQSSIMENISSQVLDAPPPIISRAFNELADGLVKYEDCIKLVLIPFPIPYTQTASWCLILHWFLTPFHLCALCQQPTMVALYTGVNVFSFWCMFKLSEQMENPFGEDEIDLDLPYFQRKMNSQLLLLLSPNGAHRPQLRPESRNQEGLPLVGSLATVLQVDVGGHHLDRPQLGRKAALKRAQRRSQLLGTQRTEPKPTSREFSIPLPVGESGVGLLEEEDDRNHCRPSLCKEDWVGIPRDHVPL